MFNFNYADGATLLSVWGVWIIVFVALFAFNEVARRFKYVGFVSFVILPLGLSVLWFTVLRDTTYTDWFHLAKVYCATAGWLGICINKHTAKDGSKDMLWPDMLWFWIIAYDLWNFAYTYNCLPGHAWYCGFALLLAPTLCAFTVGKGAWLQHRAQTLAIWCMFAQTFPAFIDKGAFAVASTYNETALFAASFISLAVNIAVFAYMIYKVVKTKRNPYLGELYTDLKEFKEINALAE